MTVNRSFNYHEMESPLWMTYQENSNATLAHKLCLVGQWQHTNTHKKTSQIQCCLSAVSEREFKGIIIDILVTTINLPLPDQKLWLLLNL